MSDTTITTRLKQLGLICVRYNLVLSFLGEKIEEMRPILRNKTNVIRSFFLRRNASLLDNNSDDTTLSWRRVVGQNEVIIQCPWLAVLRLILHTCHAARCAPPGVIRTPPGFTVSSPSWCGRRWNSDVLHLASHKAAPATFCVCFCFTRPVSVSIQWH